jgi:hypothetical protein
MILPTALAKALEMVGYAGVIGRPTEVAHLRIELTLHYVGLLKIILCSGFND